MYVYSDILPSNWIMYTIISVFKLKLQWVNLTCFKKAWYHLNRRKNSYKMVLVKKIESDNRIPYRSRGTGIHHCPPRPALSHNRRRASCLRRMPIIRRPTHGASRWTTGKTERRGLWTTF